MLKINSTILKVLTFFIMNFLINTNVYSKFDCKSILLQKTLNAADLITKRKAELKHSILRASKRAKVKTTVYFKEVKESYGLRIILKNRIEVKTYYLGFIREVERPTSAFRILGYMYQSIDYLRRKPAQLLLKDNTVVITPISALYDNLIRNPISYLSSLSSKSKPKEPSNIIKIPLAIFTIYQGMELHSQYLAKGIIENIVAETPHYKILIKYDYSYRHIKAQLNKNPQNLSQYLIDANKMTRALEAYYKSRANRSNTTLQTLEEEKNLYLNTVLFVYQTKLINEGFSLDNKDFIYSQKTLLKARQNNSHTIILNKAQEVELFRNNHNLYINYALIKYITSVNTTLSSKELERADIQKILSNKLYQVLNSYYNEGKINLKTMIYYLQRDFHMQYLLQNYKILGITRIIKSKAKQHNKPLTIEIIRKHAIQALRRQLD